MEKWLHFCSRSWTFGVKKQSGRWDLLIHPFGSGSSSHLQVKSVTLQGLGYELLIPTSKLLLMQIVPLQSRGLFMWDRCDSRAMFSLSIKDYSVATHRTKTHLPFTLMDCNRWPWCRPSVASEHPWALGTWRQADVILPARHALVALSWGSHMDKS